jgi:hypothetical protein
MLVYDVSIEVKYMTVLHSISGITDKRQSLLASLYMSLSNVAHHILTVSAAIFYTNGH